MEQSNLQDVLNAGAAQGAVRAAQPDAIPFAVVPVGYTLHDLEETQLIPQRKRGNVKALDVDSFNAFVLAEKQEARIYADVDYEKSTCTVVAVLNDHGENPAWRDYKMTYIPKASIEWSRWAGMDKVAKAQADFAAFIEDNMADISGGEGFPSGADMLKMALDFEATSEKRFKRRIDLQAGGVQLEYIDKADEQTSQKFRLFERFTIGIPVFQGDDHGYKIEARLKFRQNGDGLSFWFELIRKDRIYRAAVTDQLAKIKEVTKLPLIYGSI